MSKIFKPRRGKASTMAGTKSSTVLAAGEMFIELPDTGVGTGVCKMKMGDGVTSYASLPYAMGGDIATTEITGGIVEDGSSSATAALANVTTGKTLGQIIGSLRKACQLNASAIATLNDDLNIRTTSGLYWNAYKISRLVFFNYKYTSEASSNMTAGTWNTAATINNLSFAPISMCDIIINNNNGKTNDPASLVCICRFYSDGKVLIWPYVNNPNPIFSCTYISVQ